MSIDKILPYVRKPSRYINSEWNSVHKISAEVKICFCFPDLNELASSNLGVEILYHLVNSRQDSLAERCYSPDIDLEEKLRKKNLPLFSLESQSPLKSFDILGFSLQYELCFTNVLTMMELSGIPFNRSERMNEHYPLVIAGGPVCFNPEPVSDFFDLFVIGDGEETVCEILDKVKQLKVQSSKFKILQGLSEIDGVYVPLVHKSKENLKITKRSVDLNTSFFPESPVVPIVQTVHDRLNVEISRGCAFNCKFCQASNIYHPWRERSCDIVIEYIKRGLKSTGHNCVTLSSFCINGYSNINTLIKSVSEYCLPRNVSISVPSLKCDNSSIELMPYLIYPQRANITFAVEAGSERLRKLIGKNISDQDIYDVVFAAYCYGWKTVKLYFMIGLPTETKEDMEAIVMLINKLKRLIPGIKYNVTVSFFVPKAHTPFQWAAMDSFESLSEKKKFLVNKLRANVRAHNLQMSYLEAVFARGDSRLSQVIVNAWQNGARFDHWEDNFKNSVWNDAFKTANIDTKAYTGERKSDEALPWEHICIARSKEVLLSQYENVLEKSKAQPEPAKEQEIILKRVEHSRQVLDSSLPNPKFFYRLRFKRTGKLKYMSHLEQVELIRKGITRASLPVNYTTGFHPQLKISFGPAIAVGYESECEFADVELFKMLSSKEVATAINAQLPADFAIVEIRVIPAVSASIDSLANVVEYYLQGFGDIKLTNDKILSMLASHDIQAEIKKRDSIQVINIRPFIYNIKADEKGLVLFLRFGKGSVKPEVVAGTLLNIPPEDLKTLTIIRKMLYREEKDKIIPI